MNMTTRGQIVEASRAYVGTPFGHQGRVKGRALDCVGLILSVAHDLNIVGRDGASIERTLYNTYGPQPAETYVLDCCRKHLVEKDWANVKSGDIVCMRVPQNPTHTGIIAVRDGVLYLIHAYDGGIKKCVEHILDEAWQRRIVSVFEFPGLED